MNNKTLYNLYSLNLFLIVVILANPFILYLLFKDIFIVTGIFLFVTFSVFISWRYQKKRKWILVYVINIFALISICFHFEVVFRNVFSEYVIEDLYVIKDDYYFNKPYLSQFLEDKEFNALYKTNKQGFRISEITNFEKEVNKCDWLFIGDSYTQGAQVNFEELYTSLLYRNFPDKIIINAGVSGFGLPEIYNYYKREGKNLKPKIVFVQICNFNDFMNVEEKQILFIDYLMHHSDLARFLLYNLRYLQPSTLPLGRWTEPFYNSHKQNADYNIFYKDATERKKTDLRNFKDYLVLLNKEVKKNGAELVIFQIPTKEQIYFKYFNEVVTEFKLDIHQLDMSIPNKFLNNLTDSLNIKYLDLTDDYNKSIHQVFFDYDEHLNTEGHKATAQAIRDFVEFTFGKSNFQIENSGLYAERYPSCTSNGKYIYFQSFRHNNFEIFRTPDNFNSYERLTVNDVDEIHPCASPDNTKLVFTEGDQEKGKTKVVLLNLITGTRINITTASNEFGAIPNFNIEGTKICYARWFFNEQTQMYTNPEIVIENLLNGESETIIDSDYENWRPVFSPDNKSLVFISRRRENFDLFLYDLTEKKLSQLTDTPYDEWDPQFSPNGNKIVYAAKPGSSWNLFEYNLIDQETVQVTHSQGDDWDPFYINDNEILFAGDYGFLNGIYKLNLTSN